MKTLIVAIVSIFLSVAAQFSLKAGMSSAEIKTVMSQPLGIKSLVTILADKHILLGLLLYGLSAVAWLGVLARWDVSKAYPLVGIGFALTVMIGFFIGEGVTVKRIAGVLLISSGVVLVGRS